MMTDGTQDLIRELARAGDVLPRAAMQRALDAWPDTSPPLLTMLEAYADGRDRSGRAVGAVFFILHLVGQAREQQAFPTICRLARDTEALEDALGDGMGTSLPAILIGTYDGRLDLLRSLIEDDAADEMMRAAGFDALTYLTAAGTLPLEGTHAYLRDLHAGMKPQGSSFTWFGWQQAVALLGLEDLRPLVEDAFRRGLIDPSIMGVEHFVSDLEAGVRSADRIALLAEKGIAPFADVIATLSTWHAFSEEHRREKAALAAGGAPGMDWDLMAPVTNPLRAVGRNDPCPCGSGRKFKKCCLQ